MKTKLTKMIMSTLAFGCASVCLAAAMALGTSATAQSASNAHCSLHTLRGLYLWTADGYQNFGGSPVPKDLVEGLRFNGDGTVVAEFGTVNIGGTFLINAAGATGTYTMNPDCTGTLSIGPDFNIYVGPGAQQLWIIQTGGGPGDGTGLAVGTATRVP